MFPGFHEGLLCSLFRRARPPPAVGLGPSQLHTHCCGLQQPWRWASGCSGLLHSMFPFCPCTSGTVVLQTWPILLRGLYSCVPTSVQARVLPCSLTHKERFPCKQVGEVASRSCFLTSKMCIFLCVCIFRSMIYILVSSAHILKFR